MFAAIALLALAIVIEVAATAVLPKTQGFSQPGWSVMVLMGYASSIALLSVIVRTIPVSVAYAAWAGVGTALVAVVGMTLLGEPVTWLKALSLTFIVVGVVGLNAGGLH